MFHGLFALGYRDTLHMITGGKVNCAALIAVCWGWSAWTTLSIPCVQQVN
jgi:hypothetical protein